MHNIFKLVNLCSLSIIIFLQLIYKDKDIDAYSNSVCWPGLVVLVYAHSTTCYEKPLKRANAGHAFVTFSH